MIHYYFLRKTALVLLWMSLLIVNSSLLWGQTPGSWQQKANFGGTGRAGAVGFSIGSKGYVGTGFDGTGVEGNFRKDFWEYDPATDTWSQKANFGGTARYYAVGFSIGSKGYVGTGDDNSFTKDFWEYNPASNTWTKKADFGGLGRSNAVGFSIGSKGYVGIGYDGNHRRDFWEYDPIADTWTKKADFGGLGRSNAVGFSIASKGYVGTGRNNSGLLKDFWEYNPASDNWTKKADFGGTARAYDVGFSITSKGYVGTGYDGNFRKDFWEYDPATNTWDQKTDFGGTARAGAVGFSIASKGYVGTGDDGGNNVYRKDFWEFTPSPPCSNPTATVSGGGTVCQGATQPNVSIALTGTAPFSLTYSNGSTTTSVSGITASPYVITQAAAGTYTVTTIRDATCSGTASGTATVVVNSLPDASFSGLNSPYCANAGAVTLTPTTTGGSFSGPGVNGNTFTPANAGSGGVISYSVTGSNSCTNSSSQNVTVNPLPNATFTGLSSSYCANAGAVTLTPTTPGGTFSGPGVSGNTFTPANAGTGGTVSYSVTGSNSCTNSSSQSVTVIPLPNASLSNNGPLSDNNQTVTLTATGGGTYAFSQGAAQQNGANGNTATVTTPGLYSVTVTANGCSATASTTVTGGANQTICRNGTAVVNVLASGNPVRYEWYRNSTSTARLTEIPNFQRGTNTASLTLTNQQTTASYYVRVTDANGSSVVYGPIKVTVNTSCNANARLGIEEMRLSITLLGNPLQGDQLRAVIGGAAGQSLNVQLLDLNGRPIRQQVWQEADSQQFVEWPLSGQASGVYLLQATTPGERQSVKLIKP